MTLVEFLRARLGEDEQTSQAATPGPWRWTGDYPEGECPHSTEWTDHGPDLRSGEDYVISSHGYDASDLAITNADAGHIARHNPARVLAEVEAKRQIIEAHQSISDNGFVICEECSHAPGEYYTVEHPCSTLRLLALPYADHAAYRPEWAP